MGNLRVMFRITKKKFGYCRQQYNVVNKRPARQTMTRVTGIKINKNTEERSVSGTGDTQVYRALTLAAAETFGYYRKSREIEMARTNAIKKIV